MKKKSPFQLQLCALQRDMSYGDEGKGGGVKGLQRNKTQTQTKNMQLAGNTA